MSATAQEVQTAPSTLWRPERLDSETAARIEALRPVLEAAEFEAEEIRHWDRGMELADHKTVTKNTGLDVYFADPRSPWQRGTNENTNRLLRQYFPKGVSMKDLTQADLDAVAARLNSRPRKTLEFDTPADRLQALLR